MIEPSAPLQTEAWKNNVLPPVEQVRPLVWSVPVVCTFYPVRYTLTYLLANEAGDFLVIDPGWDSEEGRAQVLAGIADAGLEVARMIGVIATHVHHDHRDMADWLAGIGGAWVGMHEAEAASLEDPHTAEEHVAIERAWLTSLGVPDEIVDELAHDVAFEASFPPFRRPDRILQHGEQLPLDGRALTALWTPGHTVGHVSVLDEDYSIYFSGDHVLPRIPSNIGIHPSAAPDRDSVAEFLGSLEFVKQWGDFEVCPGHEYRFFGLTERATALQERHLKRQREVAEVLQAAPETSPWAVAEQVPWGRGWDSFDGHTKRLALAEIVAHVRHYRAVA